MLRRIVTLAAVSLALGCSPDGAGEAPGTPRRSPADGGVPPVEPGTPPDAAPSPPTDPRGPFGTTAPDAAAGTAAELCNELDDDGDLAVDEGCACTVGVTQRCYPGDPATRGVGVCGDGVQSCEANGEFPAWGACVGATTAQREDCYDGLDNDCDGLTDCMDEADCSSCAIECTLTHDYDVELVEALGGAATLEACGPGCADLWVGLIGDNYWSGSCSIYEQEATIDVLSPTAVRSATLERAKWDDYMQIYLNGAMVWTGPNGNFPPETGGACELSTSWDTNPAVDLTGHFAIAGEMHFRIRVSVTGGGEGYARIRLLYDTRSLVNDRGWAPPECVEAARRIADGSCTGTVVCDDEPAGGCIDAGGVRLCEADVADAIAPAPHPGLARLCRRAQVNLTRCD